MLEGVAVFGVPLTMIALGVAGYAFFMKRGVLKMNRSMTLLVSLAVFFLAGGLSMLNLGSVGSSPVDVASSYRVVMTSQESNISSASESEYSDSEGRVTYTEANTGADDLIDFNVTIKKNSGYNQGSRDILMKVTTDEFRSETDDSDASVYKLVDYDNSLNKLKCYIKEGNYASTTDEIETATINLAETEGNQLVGVRCLFNTEDDEQDIQSPKYIRTWFDGSAGPVVTLIKTA